MLYQALSAPDSLYQELDNPLIQMLVLFATATRATHQRLYAHLLEDIATDLLPVRPNRQEPRVVKRRPQPFLRMKQPRSVFKAKLAD